MRLKLNFKNFVLFTSCFLALTTVIAQDKQFSIEGSFQGKNLFVRNPPQSDGFGFCVSKVLVNGEILPASIQNSNFEIDFSLFEIKKGEKVFVVLSHADGCEPEFINAEVLLPKSTFECFAIAAEKNGLVNWQTKAENGSLDFIIEQYRWGRWVEAGQVKGNGTNQLNKYTFQLSPHSGLNKVRVSQIDNTGEKRSSKEVSFQSTSSKVKMAPVKVTDYLYFKSNGKSVKTKFEVYDAFGNLLKLGFNEKVDCQNLVNGVYFVNFDNTTEKFIKIDQ
jgi:hypothetical protein